MKLTDVIQALPTMETLQFTLPNGTTVPSHFHVTEIGESKRRFIDCGGTIRHDNKIIFQLWTATDFDHRLQTDALSKIIEISQQKLSLPDAEVVIEYQGNDTIESYALDFNGREFLLIPLHTDCLAKDSCGTPLLSIQATDKVASSECCGVDSGCC